MDVKRMTHCLVAGITLSWLLLFASTSFAKHPATPIKGGLLIDLKKGTSKFVGRKPLCPIHLASLVDSNRDGWYEARVTVTLDRCEKVCFILEYEGKPEGWTVNIGDSPNNNGFGGGAASDSRAVAEAQIKGQLLTVFSTALGPGQVDRLLDTHLALDDGAIKLCVADDLLTLGNPQTTLKTPISELLFQIPDITTSSAFPPGNGNKDIHAGFNRVISGPGNRLGHGLARVGIVFP